VNNTVLIETVRARDGRRYPADMSEAAQRRARVLCHALICRDQLSYRAAQQAMLGYGLRRSLGWLHKTISSYACGHPRCPCVPIQQPAGQQPAEQPAAAVHQHTAGLTEQVISGGR
jgi:hypothetical protein